MEKTNKIIITMIGIIVVLLAVLSAIVLFIHKNPQNANTGEKVQTQVSEVILDECTDEFDQMEEETINTNTNQEKISPNCKLVLTRFYKQCKDEIKEYIQVPDVLVNTTREELQKQYKDWEIKEFSANQVVLYKQFDGECGEHYVLRDEEGKVNIYKILPNQEEVLYEKTEISIDYLPQDDKNSIQKGLRINGKEKLNELIESFE